HPSVFRKVNFDPGVCVLLADDIATGNVVVLSAAESIYYAGGNTQRPQHHGHGGSEIFAVAFFAIEEEISQGISVGRVTKLQGVAKVVLQVRLDGPGALVAGT